MKNGGKNKTVAFIILFSVYIYIYIYINPITVCLKSCTSQTVKCTVCYSISFCSNCWGFKTGCKTVDLAYHLSITKNDSNLLLQKIWTLISDRNIYNYICAVVLCRLHTDQDNWGSAEILLCGNTTDHRFFCPLTSLNHWSKYLRDHCQFHYHSSIMLISYVYAYTLYIHCVFDEVGCLILSLFSSTEKCPCHVWLRCYR